MLHWSLWPSTTTRYTKVSTFPYELLGDESKRESIVLMIRNLIWTNEKYGRVHVKYGKPISLREDDGIYSLKAY
jgi:glycerol-3-phosphate O-acyltransferase